MQRRAFLACAGVAISGAAIVPALARPQEVMESTVPKTKSGLAPVNGLQMYYEVHGQGEPLILLHGGVTASEVFGPNLSELAKSRQVIAVHLQGHGRTKDIDRPLRFEFMADDIAALIAHLKLGQADVMGYSLGGGVALQTVIRHPASVRRLIVISAAMTQEGSYPEVNAAFEQMGSHAAQIAQKIKGSPLGQRYPEVNWETLLRKIGEMESQSFDWSAQVKQIKSPAELIFADADSICPGHIAAFYEALGAGKRDAGLDGSLRSMARLGIVPGATHYNILSTTMVAEMALPFLSSTV
ncbi:alpha/beta hydrolase [Edaphobacter sp. HDX4]|uniref:alpha/beta fold hydrolase n=1 Tax=Edaphobacter sp. HDX4 TaxID=2794064 RepID=UPI002FE652FA